VVSLSGQAVASDPRRAGAELPDAAAALRQAQAELQAAAEQAALDRDPLAPVLVGLSSSLGALGAVEARLEAARPPLDAKERAELTRQLVQACRADFARAAGQRSRHVALLSGVGAAVLLLGALGGGYLWGRSAESAEIRAASGVIRAALSDGSASARAWADAIRRNDLVGLLSRCQGRAVWVEANGRRACSVPLWLDDPVRPAAPAEPKS
jgi:hypothetical protein